MLIEEAHHSISLRSHLWLLLKDDFLEYLNLETLLFIPTVEREKIAYHLLFEYFLYLHC